MDSSVPVTCTNLLYCRKTSKTAEQIMNEYDSELEICKKDPGRFQYIPEFSEETCFMYSLPCY